MRVNYYKSIIKFTLNIHTYVKTSKLIYYAQNHLVKLLKLFNAKLFQNMLINMQVS